VGNASASPLIRFLCGSPLSSALSHGATYLKGGGVAAVRLNRFLSNAIPSARGGFEAGQRVFLTLASAREQSLA
jgi:hypothetical protein